MAEMPRLFVTAASLRFQGIQLGDGTVQALELEPPTPVFAVVAQMGDAVRILATSENIDAAIAECDRIVAALKAAGEGVTLQ